MKTTKTNRSSINLNRYPYMKATTRKTNFINLIINLIIGLFVNLIIGLYMRSTTHKTRGQEIYYLLTLNIFNISLMGGRS